MTALVDTAVPVIKARDNLKDRIWYEIPQIEMPKASAGSSSTTSKVPHSNILVTATPLVQATSSVKRSANAARILFVTQTHGFHNGEPNYCGVGICGKMLADIFANWQQYEIEPLYTASPATLESKIKAFSPKVIIYNYHRVTCQWLHDPALRNKYAHIVHIMINYDMNQRLVDNFDPRNWGGFKFVMCDDDTLRGTDHVFMTSRLTPNPCTRLSPLSEIPIIGFQGFAFAYKGLMRLAQQVQLEFDKAILNLHVPFSSCDDPDGKKTLLAVQQVRSLITKPGIQVIATHDFKTTDELVDFMSKNTINCYMYDVNEGAGLASAPNYALAARRPIAVTKSHSLRNFWNLSPSICVEDSSLKAIIANGTLPLEPLYQKYTSSNFLKDCDGILTRFVCDLDDRKDAFFHGDPARHHWMFAYPVGNPLQDCNPWDCNVREIKRKCSNARLLSAADVQRHKPYETWRCLGHTDFKPDVALTDSMLLHRVPLLDLSTVRCAFHGAIAPFGDKYICVFHIMPRHDLAACLLDDDLRLVPGSSTIFSLPYHHMDPRLVCYEGRYFVSSFVYRYGPDTVKLVELKTSSPMQMDLSKQCIFDRVLNWTGYIKGQEKNWVPWVHEGRLLYAYGLQPHRILEVNLQTKQVTLTWETSWRGDNWWTEREWQGPVPFRLNSPPILLPDGTYLSTFHTLRRVGINRNYWIGFYLFDGKPPFRVLKISREPFVTPKCRFPEGAVDNDPHTKLVFFPMSLVLNAARDTLLVFGGTHACAVTHCSVSLQMVLDSLSYVE